MGWRNQLAANKSSESDWLLTNMKVTGWTSHFHTRAHLGVLNVERKTRTIILKQDFLFLRDLLVS